jgi:RHS repeat-associated protein
VDNSGLATLTGPGLVWITAATNNALTRVPVLIKPGPRPIQTDSEWQTEQDQLQPDGTVSTTTGGTLFNSIGAALMPTAHAQTLAADSGDFAYDELWSEPRNLVGSPRNRIATASPIGPVLPEGSNFEFAVPLYNLTGRGLTESLALNYNSRIWSRHGSAVTFNAVNTWPYLGFTLSFGRIVTYAAGSNTKFLLIDSDGTRRYLGSGNGSVTTTYQTNDGSHVTYVGTNSGGTLYYNNGVQKAVTLTNNRLLVTRVTDANGNFISISYASQSQGNCTATPWKQAISGLSDTMGRVITFNYDTCNNLVSIDAPGYGGDSQNPVTTTIARFDYTGAQPSSSFSGLTVENLPNGVQTPVLLSHVYFPATDTGYKFTYSDYGMITKVSVRKAMSYNSTTGAISDGTEKAYVSNNYPAAASSLTDAPSFSSWTQWPAATATGGTATWSFISSTGVGTKSFTITNPDASTLTLTRAYSTGTTAEGLLTQSEVKTSGGTSKAKSVIGYTTDGGGEPQVANIVTYDDATPTANQTKVDFDYDSYGNVTNTREYGFQQSGSFVVRRRTHNVYKTDTGYVNAYLRSLVTETDVYDSQANDSVPVAKTTYAYDDYAAMGGMENYGGTTYAVGHLSSYDTTVTVRGNVTAVTNYTDVNTPTSITHYRKIDIFGNVVKEELTCCNVQTVTTDESNGFGIITEVKKGDPSGTTLTTQYESDFNTSLQKRVTNPNGLVTEVTSRDAALRPTTVTLPALSGTIAPTRTASYNDSTLTVSKSLNYTDDGTSKTVTDTTTTDGWGRVIEQRNVYGGQVNTEYDQMGRVSRVSNPFTAGGTPSYWTSYSYDALGRQTTVTLPDTQTVTTAYSGNSVTVTDQVNRQTQRLTDGLGRLITVNEQDSSGSLTQATNYTYDVLNNLTQVNQGNQLRSYRYDAMSRLTGEKIPEQGDPTQASQWTTTYTYTDFNQVATRTDARGVVTSYMYDSLHRLTQVSYNTVNGVTTAPTVSYTYDSDSTYGVTAAGHLLRVNVGSDYQERYTFDPLYRTASVIRTIGTRTYTTAYNRYNQAGQVTQMTYPSARVLNVGHDSAGRLDSLYEPPPGGNGVPINYLTSVSYNVAGQVTDDVLGNGVTEQYGYDAARLQLTSQKAGTASPYTNRLDLTYTYNATSSGQFGVGTTSGNPGQLLSVSGTINGATESASYTYDNLGRLLTSSQTSNSTSAQRRFAYDRWGNRTGVWDATSGGTQIQSVSLQSVSFPSTGSAPTNHITSVTNSGSTVSYTYDSVGNGGGNVVNDGSHSYAYDSESRLVSVDGGTTASYAYDQQNRRYKKTVGSTVTHYLWEGNQVLAEHNGSTGAAQTDYIGSGSRMIAKVASGATSYILSDRLSVRLTLNSSGAVVGQQGHLPFGEDFAESGTQQKQHFTNYERDSESGTDYAVNRQYNQSVGRFNRVDPKAGVADNPQSLNRYSYTLNNPVGLIDPNGLWHTLPSGEAVGDFAGEFVPGLGYWFPWENGGLGGWGTPTNDRVQIYSDADFAAILSAITTGGVRRPRWISENESRGPFLDPDSPSEIARQNKLAQDLEKCLSDIQSDPEIYRLSVLAADKIDNLVTPYDIGNAITMGLIMMGIGSLLQRKPDPTMFWIGIAVSLGGVVAQKLIEYRGLLNQIADLAQPKSQACWEKFNEQGGIYTTGRLRSYLRH